MKKFKTLLVSAIAALTMGAACTMTAAAEDMNDVAQALRETGVPESQIQAMLNAYQYCEKDEYGVYFGGDYYPYAGLVGMIEIMGAEEVNRMIEENMDTAIKEYEEMMATATTTTVTTTGSGSGGSNTTTTTTAAKTFEEMTMEEKVVYLSSLSEEERKVFMENLTIDEKQSILMQMDTDSKAALLDKFAQIMEELGFHMTVDNIQDDQVDISLRDGQGNLIDSSSMGVIVEDTGWNLTGWFALASVLVLVSMGGIGYVMYRSSKASEEEQNG